MIELKNLSKQFETLDGSVDALRNINLTIRDGDVYGIIGMSGAGKSTLVRCINMLERPTEGSVLVNGQDSQEIQYKLNSSKINVHSESLVVYPSLEALKTGDHAVSFDFNKPIDLKGCFGQDAHVIVAITLKADYDANSTGVRRFSADQNWIDQMMAMIK